MLQKLYHDLWSNITQVSMINLPQSLAKLIYQIVELSMTKHAGFYLFNSINETKLIVLTRYTQEVSIQRTTHNIQKLKPFSAFEQQQQGKNQFSAKTSSVRENNSSPDLTRYYINAFLFFNVSYLECSYMYRHRRKLWGILL